MVAGSTAMFGDTAHDLHSAANDVKLTSGRQLVENDKTPADALGASSRGFVVGAEGLEPPTSGM